MNYYVFETINSCSILKDSDNDMGLPSLLLRYDLKH